MYVLQTGISNLHAGGAVHNLARLRQLYPEPRHIHGVQPGLQGRLQEDHDLQYFSPDQTINGLNNAAFLMRRSQKANVDVRLLSKNGIRVANTI